MAKTPRKLFSTNLKKRAPRTARTSVYRALSKRRQVKKRASVQQEARIFKHFIIDLSKITSN